MTTNTNRRKFLKGGAVAAGAAAATLAMPNVSRAETTTLKMQSSWGSTSPFQLMAQQYIDRATAMAGGRLKIDLLPSGAVVKAFQVQDACHKGALDAAHTVTAYWYGKNKAASLFGTGPVFGCNASQILAWIHYGGGKELYSELINDILKRGGQKSRMEAKVFGGANVIDVSAKDTVGIRNAQFVKDYLRSEGIRLAASDTGGDRARRVYFFPSSGRVSVLRLPASETRTMRRTETQLERKVQQAPRGGGLELF